MLVSLYGATQQNAQHSIYLTLMYTVLGFSDFKPVATLGQALTIIKTALDTLLFALIVFVFGRRVAR